MLGGGREEAERIVAPSTRDRFEWLLDDEEGQPEMFVPIDMHHYDEDDYRDHRHRAYPHMHQPLKSMEPRVLMEIKSRIKANKRAEEKAAKAGVITSVPAILANASDTRVLIDLNSGVSGPVLSLVRDPESFQIPMASRKKRKRKRKRSKKPEPFQPTLCKLSEESSSPLHNAMTDDCDSRSLGGLVLEELSEAMKSIQDYSPSSQDYTPSIVTKLSFLDEISSTDAPIGFLDIASHRNTTRQYSLPFFNTVAHAESSENMSTSHSGLDLKKHSKHLHFQLPCEEDLPSLLTLTRDIASDPRHAEDIVDYFQPPSTSQVVISHITHSQEDLHKVILTEVVRTPAITSESAIKISNCNFQIGSVDNVTEAQQNIVKVEDQPALSSHRSVSEPVEYINSDKSNLGRRHNDHHYHHHHKEHYNKRDLDKRTFSGQDMRSLWQCKDAEEIDEYESTLGDAIIDDMRNHRCYDMPALNRTRVHNKYIHSNRRTLHRSRSVTHPRTEERDQRGRQKLKKCTTSVEDTYKLSEYSKSQQDLIFQSNVCAVEWNSLEAMQENPLPLFVEMDILRPNKYWREISRWVRYEQSYNELSDTFGRAHSSPLKFTAFTQFRVQLENAIFLPHVEAKTFDEAISILTEELLVAQLFTEPKDALFVKDVFKWKHVHAGEKFPCHEGDDQLLCESACDLSPNENNECNMRLINTSPGNFNNTSSLQPTHPRDTKISFEHMYPKSKEPNNNNKLGQHSNFPSMIKMLKNSIPMLRHAKYHKSDLEGHLPLNTEGVTVQVGALESLKKPFLAIMRFKNAMFMDKVTELNLPIRFLIICLGPPAKVQYEEVGRVISTMLVNKDFCKLMYRATDKCEIVEGLYKYLDRCFVLSYAEPRPTRNVHSMADHINDFVRIQSNPSPYRTVSKTSEEIMPKDSMRFNVAVGGDIIRQKVIYEQSESDQEKSKDKEFPYEADYCHVDFKQSKDHSKPKRSPFKKKRAIQYRGCCNLSFFLFRLLRLDLIKYKERFISDFKDAFLRENVIIVLCGLVYLYFVCLSPALTFGVLLGDLVSTEFNVQMVLVCNGFMTILFALVGGNPIIIIGITGPMFLMEAVIAKMASNFNVPIMLYRFLISIYVSVIGLVAVSLNITWVLQKVRRSVEECFNGFVGLYFIFKAGLTILRIFTRKDIISYDFDHNTTSKYEKYQKPESNNLAIGFASLVLAYSMYQICMVLNSIKRGRFFTRKFRKMVDYFNVAIGILVLSLINIVLLNIVDISLPTLKAETSTNSWVKIPSIRLQLPLVPFPAHLVAFSLAFALMSLIFTETAISGITVTKVEKKLVKSSLFAQDQFMCLCVIPIICGVLGWPFLSGAAVRSSSHVIAMTKLDEKVIPGVKHKILGVVEQRVTMTVVGCLILGTVSLESVLGYVPTSAMLGMFLYMGVMGIRDLVVTRRLVAMFKRQKHWKDHEYLRNIPPSVLKSFEVLQLVMIAVMFSMNCITEFTGISWPSFLIPVILLCFALIREIVLPRFHYFTPHLDKLDPRHFVQMVPLCISQRQKDSFSDKVPTLSVTRASDATVLQGTSLLVTSIDSRFDTGDSTNTSGDEMDSSSTSDLDP